MLDCLIFDYPIDQLRDRPITLR
ncbi:hypothetical protein AERO9A_420048 [Aeromonas salmonicida]|nr:hypothetical protein AERO9A_420048 [Aeromonas salmonicida]